MSMIQLTRFTFPDFLTALQERIGPFTGSVNTRIEVTRIMTEEAERESFLSEVAAAKSPYLIDPTTIRSVYELEVDVLIATTTFTILSVDPHGNLEWVFEDIETVMNLIEAASVAVHSPEKTVGDNPENDEGTTITFSRPDDVGNPADQGAASADGPDEEIAVDFDIDDARVADGGALPDSREETGSREDDIERMRRDERDPDRIDETA